MAVLIPITPSASRGGAPLPEDPQGRVIIQQAQRTIAAYHAGQPKSHSVLRVVYFHPNDRDPLPNYAERLDRVLNDVSDFYRDGLRRFGIANDGLPLERKDGRLVLHVVRGKTAASGYTHESGDATTAEVRAALKGTVDVDREHVLILYALCRKEPDGRYVFDAPYYGDGSSNQRRGLCHAADCELLDPQLLTEKRKKIVYTEHYYPRVEQTVAKFNSWYLGGVAHELGHGFGLPHDAGSDVEQRFGTSLMGGGNHTYRQERWGGGAFTLLSRATALRLAAHPLFTGSNHGRWDAVGVGFTSLNFTAPGRVLQIDGAIQGGVPPYAALAHVWPTREKTDHGARTFLFTPLPNGTFRLHLAGLKTGDYRMKVVSLHVNGGFVTRHFQFGVDADGRPDAAALNGAWLSAAFERAERATISGQPNARSLLTDEAMAQNVTPEERRKFQLLRAVLDPAPPLALADIAGNQVFLSDVAWTDAKTGWGQPARNHCWFDESNQTGVLLLLGGQFFDKGLYAHSPSRYTFALDGKWRSFTATVGLRDGAQEQGSAVFTVRGDGRELYRSPMLRVGARADVKIDVAGVKRIELLTEGGEGHPHNSWAIWTDPAVAR